IPAVVVGIGVLSGGAHVATLAVVAVGSVVVGPDLVPGRTALAAPGVVAVALAGVVVDGRAGIVVSVLAVGAVVAAALVRTAARTPGAGLVWFAGSFATIG